MGRAIVAMAEQQIEIQRQQQALGARLDRAGQVVRDMQHQIGDIEVRLGVLEDRVHPSALISEVQANAASLKVKALAAGSPGTAAGSQAVPWRVSRRSWAG